MELLLLLVSLSVSSSGYVVPSTILSGSDQSPNINPIYYPTNPAQSNPRQASPTLYYHPSSQHPKDPGVYTLGQGFLIHHPCKLIPQVYSTNPGVYRIIRLRQDDVLSRERTAPDGAMSFTNTRHRPESYFPGLDVRIPEGIPEDQDVPDVAEASPIAPELAPASVNASGGWSLEDIHSMKLVECLNNGTWTHEGCTPPPPKIKYTDNFTPAPDAEFINGSLWGEHKFKPNATCNLEEDPERTQRNDSDPIMNVTSVMPTAASQNDSMDNATMPAGLYKRESPYGAAINKRDQSPSFDEPQSPYNRPEYIRLHPDYYNPFGPLHAGNSRARVPWRNDVYVPQQTEQQSMMEEPQMADPEVEVFPTFADSDKYQALQDKSLHMRSHRPVQRRVYGRHV